VKIIFLHSALCEVVVDFKASAAAAASDEDFM